MRVPVCITGCQDSELIPKTDKWRQTATKKGTRCSEVAFPSTRLNPFESSAEESLKKTNSHMQQQAGEGGICQRLLRLSSCCLECLNKFLDLTMTGDSYERVLANFSMSWGNNAKVIAVCRR